MGSVKLICTRPSPRWSAYGLTALWSTSLGIAGLAHQLDERVEVSRLGAHDPLDPAALVLLAADVAERRVLDRLEEARLGDPLEQLVGSREHLLRPGLD